MAKTDKVKGPEKTPTPKPLPLSGYKRIPHFSSGSTNCCGCASLNQRSGRRFNYIFHC